MTSYRLYPSNPTLASGSFSSTFTAGISWEAASSWLEGYWFYVPASGGATAPQKFALWCLTSASAGTVIPAATVMSGTLTAGQWNFVPLTKDGTATGAPTSIPIATANPYLAATTFTAAGSFAAQDDQFSSGGPFASGISNGPLFAYSDGTAGGTLGTSNPWGGMAQGVFSTTITDPAVGMPLGSSSSANFGIDVQVSDTPPASYKGPWSLYPNTVTARPPAVADAAVPYGVAVEIECTSACTCTAIRYYSPAAATVLASWCGVWDVATQACIAEQLSPSWGTLGSGWVQATLATPAQLVPGKRYKLQVNVTTNSVATVKDGSDPWGTGKLSDGITAGPVTAVPLAIASDAWNYNNNPAGTPPYSDGTHLSHGQSTFSQTATPFSGRPPYPLLWAVSGGSGSQTQDYFVDGVFFTSSGSGALMAASVI